MALGGFGYGWVGQVATAICTSDFAENLKKAAPLWAVMALMAVYPSSFLVAVQKHYSTRATGASLTGNCA